jgi:hypothetical protein
MALQLKMMFLATMLTSSAALKQEIHQQSACTCMGWKWSYENLDHAILVAALPNCALMDAMWGRGDANSSMEMCSIFYQNIPEAICLTKGLPVERISTCLVSALCKQTNGGELINGTQVREKNCISGKDEILGEKTPPELVEFARKNDLDVRGLVKLAYPEFTYGGTHGSPWLSVKRHEESAEEQSMLQEVQASGVPTIITGKITWKDHDQDEEPIAVIFGNSVLEITIKQGFLNGEQQELAKLHPFNINFQEELKDWTA